MMNDYNSNQIMMLVSQMKSASATKNNVLQSERSPNSGTLDEEQITAILKNSMQLGPGKLVKQGSQNKSKVSLQTNSDLIISRLLGSNRNDSMSMAEIQDLTPSD